MKEFWLKTIYVTVLLTLVSGILYFFIGYDENSQRIIYDYEKMAEHLMDQDGMTYEEAVEFIDYNTAPACPYMGSNAPIILRNITDYINIRNNG